MQHIMSNSNQHSESTSSFIHVTFSLFHSKSCCYNTPLQTDSTATSIVATFDVCIMRIDRLTQEDGIEAENFEDIGHKKHLMGIDMVKMVHISLSDDSGTGLFVNSSDGRGFGDVCLSVGGRRGMSLSSNALNYGGKNLVCVIDRNIWSSVADLWR